MSRPIYVEARIRGSMDELWQRTQVAEDHEQWDLRFSSITYLERESEAEPQRFRYATRIGFGWEIAGWGESVGDRRADGVRTSALKFGSDDSRSLIRLGSGYWKYQPIRPVGDGEVGDLRFITGYNYDVRGGLVGRIFDRWLFRPLMGWATAWSFDRLRLWIESGIDPGGSARRAVTHAVAALTVAFVWIWHGLVPKLLGPHEDELAMLVEAGVEAGLTESVVTAVGIAEVTFGLVVLWFARRRWPWILTIALMIAATVGVAWSSPGRLLGAFGPVTLNLQMVALSILGLLSLKDLPSARNCLRRPPKNEPEPEE